MVINTDMPANTSQFQLPDRNNFQQAIDGRQTDLFILQNENGVKVAITNYGARIVSLIVPDKNGTLRDVVVGFDSINGFVQSSEKYYGAIVGRYANRIAKGKFRLDGKEYSLATNNGVNHLHGGLKGFDSVVWTVASAVTDSALELFYLSKDTEEGYPGNLGINVRYELTNKNGLKISFKATTDKTTLINVTNHAYFNLNGVGSGSIENHSLMINADYYTPIDNTSIPLGKIAAVEGTPFDFRSFRKIGERINVPDEQLRNGEGYDHNFALNKKSGALTLAAKAQGDESGIILEVYTTEPGLQLYTGNFMKGDNKIKYGLTDDCRTAFCLETQHFPDSPNHPNFPTTVLMADQVFQSETVFQF